MKTPRPQREPSPAVAALNPPRLLSVRQAAEYLSLAHVTVYELCKAKLIEHYRMGAGGGTIRISPAACDAYLRRCAKGPEEAVLPEPVPTRKKKPQISGGLQIMPLPRVMREQLAAKMAREA